MTIVEPILDITKTVDDDTVAYGQTITYSVNLAHTAASTADAQDLTITDTVPTYLTYVPGSITAASWLARR